MKTFKLKGLKIMKNEEQKLHSKVIPLLDGLVINREDEDGWLIEAFIEQEYMSFFESIQDNDELMIQVKITREENDPAFFITEIDSINEINEGKMNVLFRGNVVDHRKSRIEELLEGILRQGYQGESLLKKFKESI